MLKSRKRKTVPPMLHLYLASMLLLGGADEVWTEREAEHLLNRAGFGASTAEIRVAVQQGRAACVERLFAARVESEPPYFERVRVPTRSSMRELTEEERRAKENAARDLDRRQLVELTHWWLGRMVAGTDPLRDKATLFLHGWFVSSSDKVTQAWPMIEQHRFLREHALGSYATLLRGIVRDPAMLVYLDNTANRRGRPNENLARELMELFSLGVGPYTEADVKAAARALTGRTVRDNEYVFDAAQHDTGDKTVLGTTGPLDGERLVDVLLAHEACARHVARRILWWYEGVEPEAARVDQYATLLRAEDWNLGAVLRALFMDDAFYREEIVGARVSSPVEQLVGVARRLRLDPPEFVLNGGSILLGQKLFAPPTVKGWDEGFAWISTATLMQRGNLAGLLLGTVTLNDVVSQADLLAGDPMQLDEAMSADMGAEMSMERMKELKPGRANGAAISLLRRLDATGYLPRIHLCARLRALHPDRAADLSDAEIVDALLADLLAIPIPEETRERMLVYLAGERADRDLREGEWLRDEQTAERILRRVAHLILSLPEAQLH